MTSAFIIGGTGEVGKHVVAELAKSPQFEKIVIFSRHAHDIQIEGKEKLVWEVVPNFDNLEAHKSAIKGCQAGFCTLGSTKAKAGSAEAFEHIDYGYTMNVAKMAKEIGCQWFGVVTAVGANAESSFLYPRVKGMIERDLTKIDFNKLEIFRPAMLICDRKESRVLESIGQFFCKGINFIIPDRMAIKTETVAAAMVKQAVRFFQSSTAQISEAISIHDNYAIAQLAKE